MTEQKETDKNLYLLLGEMKGMLSTALSGIETMKEDHKEHKEEIDHRLNGHSDRLTKIEQFQWKTMGIVGAAVLIIPVTLTIVQVVLN